MHHLFTRARVFASLSLALALSAHVPARAHVGLEAAPAQAGATLKAAFRISHGCGASPTRQVVVEIPAGVRAARPFAKSGWSIAIERASLALPYTSHGRTVTEDVTRITWTARFEQDMLDASAADDFSLIATLPPAEGELFWPVRQVCPQGRLDWVQVPDAQHPPASLSSPAVRMEVGAPAHAAHHH